ncbi:MAG TPA: ABC transporter permease, partial [Deinococcales bacterium]|nr:ABC transporter permease [Deinococcales bacterium]
MLRGLFRRLLGGLAVLLAVSLATFALSFLLPADPARMVAGPSATVQTVNNIRHELGLDRPLPVQYATYLGKLLHGDLGRSFKQNIDVTTLVASRFGATFLLMLAGIAFELLLGLPAGILAALRPGGWLDRTVMSLSFLGVSAPQFVLGLMLLYFLAFRFPIFPLGGSGTFMHLVLPAFTLGVGGAGWYARMVRSSLL